MHISPKTFSSLGISTVILRLLLKQIAMNTHDYHHHGTGTIGVYYTGDDYRFCGNESTTTPKTFVILISPLSISFPLLTKENKFNWYFFVFSVPPVSSPSLTTLQLLLLLLQQLPPQQLLLILDFRLAIVTFV